MTCSKFAVSPVSSTSETDLHDIVEILLKVVFNTTIPPPTLMFTPFGFKPVEDDDYFYIPSCARICLIIWYYLKTALLTLVKPHVIYWNKDL